MGRFDGGIPPVTEPWAKQDIVYVAIITPVMLCAFIEWFLWLASFGYCIARAYTKATHWSERVLCALLLITFVGLRGTFLPVMLVCLPLPPTIGQYFPTEMVNFLQWFAFWTFALLLVVPWLFCVYQLATSHLGRRKQIHYVLDEQTAPKTVVVMPVYKEDPDILIKAVNSVIECDYPRACIHVFLSFDGDQVDELLLKTLANLGVVLEKGDEVPRCIDITYKDARVTLSRFPHGGKRKAQKRTFKLIDQIYEHYLKRYDDLFILFIDSDCVLDKYCIQNFMYEMELKPGSKRNMLAMTGVITCTTEKQTLVTLLQDMEYIHGQLFERSVESGCGSVTCLPGALTILRFSGLRKMSKYYFAPKAEDCLDLFDFGKCHLGEDRWLTHLFMIAAKERYQIQMCTSAFCKTESVQTFQSLLKQRRRWFIGFITNEVCMLTDMRLWKQYPLLCTVRFMQNTIRTTALLFFIMVISIMTTSNKVKNLPVGFIAVSLGLNYLLMIYFGIKLARYKAWLYPIMFILNPFFNWIYMVYGIFTCNQRTWGGPRADADKADAPMAGNSTNGNDAISTALAVAEATAEKRTTPVFSGASNLETGETTEAANTLGPEPVAKISLPLQPPIELETALDTTPPESFVASARTEYVQTCPEGAVVTQPEQAHTNPGRPLSASTAESLGWNIPLPLGWTIPLPQGWTIPLPQGWTIPLPMGWTTPLPQDWETMENMPDA